jgi:hypothetical protein
MQPAGRADELFQSGRRVVVHCGGGQPLGKPESERPRSAAPQWLTRGIRPEASEGESRESGGGDIRCSAAPFAMTPSRRRLKVRSSSGGAPAAGGYLESEPPTLRSPTRQIAPRRAARPELTRVRRSLAGASDGRMVRVVRAQCAVGSIGLRSRGELAAAALRRPLFSSHHSVHGRARWWEAGCPRPPVVSIIY